MGWEGALGAHLGRTRRHPDHGSRVKGVEAALKCISATVRAAEGYAADACKT